MSKYKNILIIVLLAAIFSIAGVSASKMMNYRTGATLVRVSWFCFPISKIEDKGRIWDSYGPLTRIEFNDSSWHAVYSRGLFSLMRSSDTDENYVWRSMEQLADAFPFMYREDAVLHKSSFLDLLNNEGPYEAASYASEILANMSPRRLPPELHVRGQAVHTNKVNSEGSGSALSLEFKENEPAVGAEPPAPAP